MSNKKLITLSRRHPTGQYTETANHADVLDEVYRVWTPRGYVWTIDPDRPFLIDLATVETVTFDGSHSSTPLAANQIARILNAAGGYTDGQNVEVFLAADGTKRTVSAVGDNIDGTDPGEVTCSDDTAADHQVAYIPFEDGKLIILAEAPTGMGVKSIVLAEYNTTQLFTMNQWRFNRLSCPIALPEDFAIVFKLKASWLVAYQPGSTGVDPSLAINRIQIPVIQEPLSNYAVAGEPHVGDTFRKVMEKKMSDLAY